MRNLLWKEWHEQRWKLAFGSLMLAAFALIGLRARIIADEMVVRYVCGIAVLMLPILASTGLVPAERNDGTLETLMSLPIRTSLILLAKTLMGIALCAGPILLTMVVSLLVSGEREMSASAIVGLYVSTLLTNLSLFFWMFALSIRLPTETRAAVIAVGVLVIWLMVSLGLSNTTQSQTLPTLLWTTNPFIFCMGRGDAVFPIGRNVWPVSPVIPVCIQAIIAIASWFWAARLLARPQEGR